MSSMTQAESERYAKLAAQVEFPTAWTPHKTPEQPRTLVGEALRWDTGLFNSGNGGAKDEIDILIVREEDGTEWSVWPFHTQLRNALLGREENGARPPVGDVVAPGDLVAVAYGGQHDIPDRPGQTAHRYRVAIEKAPARTEPASSQLSANDGIPF